MIADMSATSHFKQKVNMGDMGAGRSLIEQLRPVQLMRNALYVSTGTERFLEAAYLSGLASSDWTWTVKIIDLDNDGLNDVFFTNGMARNFTDADIQSPAGLVGAARWSFFKDKSPRKERNLAFRRTGPLQFEDVSANWGLDHHGMSYASAHGDLDGDGDLDLVVANLDEGVSVYENLTSQRNSVLVELRPASGNYSAIGAVVRLVAGNRSQVRQLQPVSGYLASNEPVLHFGIGDEQKINVLTIQWPSGQQQTLQELTPGFRYTITEPSKVGRSTATSNAQSRTPLFAPYRLGARVIHREVEFDDFSVQPLLPFKLSQLGPSMAWGDIDRDGDDDLFLGQGSGWMSMLYRRSSDGRFVPDPQAAFARDEACEDMGAAFFDVDGDDDLDLYVASGGYEFEAHAPQLRDRLNLNDGRGGFTAAPPASHPALAGSNGPVAAADYDRDGDLDLFVGGRMVPGAYPVSGTSTLLRNESGRLVDVTTDIAVELGECGMVTSALWSDFDGDHAIDLITTHDWGPVRVWRNIGGRFSSEAKSNMRGLTGWAGGGYLCQSPSEVTFGNPIADPVRMINVVWPDRVEKNSAQLGVFDVKRTELDQHVFTPPSPDAELVERILMASGEWSVSERPLSSWPSHYADDLARKEIVPADIFLLIDPLVSISTAVASRQWVWSLGCAAMILIVCIVIPRGFCGYLCPLGTLIDLFDWAIAGRVGIE